MIKPGFMSYVSVYQMDGREVFGFLLLWLSPSESADMVVSWSWRRAWRSLQGHRYISSANTNTNEGLCTNMGAFLLWKERYSTEKLS